MFRYDRLVDLFIEYQRFVSVYRCLQIVFFVEYEHSECNSRDFMKCPSSYSH